MTSWSDPGRHQDIVKFRYVIRGVLASRGAQGKRAREASGLCVDHDSKGPTFMRRVDHHRP
jgi:hypothetical protein